MAECQEEEAAELVEATNEAVNVKGKPSNAELREMLIDIQINIATTLQGCCLTGARSPGAPKLYMRATKFLYKEPARTPINLRLSWDNGPYVPINLVLLAELQTMELFMHLAQSHTW